MRDLLGSDFKKASADRAVAREKSRDSARRRLFWAGLIIAAGLLYFVFRVTTSPAKVIVINTSGDPAASVVVISGSQRVNLGEVANGAVQQVALTPGRPLQIEYNFGSRRVWVDTKPLMPLQVVTVTLTIDQKVRVVHQAPLAREPSP